MPPKSLAEWLADSSDDDEKDTEVLTTHQQAKTPTSSTVKTPTTNFTTATAIKSPVVSAAAIASAGAHQHQNNKTNSLSTTPRNTSLSTTPTNPALLAIRERMQNLLGSETVSKIVEENRQVKPAVISSSSSSDSSDSDDDDDRQQQKVVAPVAVNKTGKKKNGAESDKNLEGTLVTPNAGENLMVTAVAVEPSYEEYDVEVVDRGCQTINEIETQTDPEPDVFSCPCCYQEYFGHQAGNSNIPLACHPHPQHHQQLYYPPPHHPYYYSYPPQQQQQQASSFPQSLTSMNPNTLGTSNNNNQQNEGLTKSSSRIPASVINAQVDSIQRQIDSIMKRLGGGGI